MTVVQHGRFLVHLSSNTLAHEDFWIETNGQLSQAGCSLALKLQKTKKGRSCGCSSSSLYWAERWKPSMPWVRFPAFSKVLQRRSSSSTALWRVKTQSSTFARFNHVSTSFTLLNYCWLSAISTANVQSRNCFKGQIPAVHGIEALLKIQRLVPQRMGFCERWLHILRSLDTLVASLVPWTSQDLRSWEVRRQGRWWVFKLGADNRDFAQSFLWKIANRKALDGDTLKTFSICNYFPTSPYICWGPSIP